MSYVCKYCGKRFEKSSSIGGHTIRCKENSQAKEIFKKIGEKQKGKSKENLKKKKERVLACVKCGKDYKICCTDHKIEIGNFNKHCSRSCANSHVRTEESKERTSVSMKNSEKVKIANKLPRKRPNSFKTEKIINICPVCFEEIVTTKKRNKIYHKKCWQTLSGGLKENSTKVHKCEYKGFKLDSGLERSFAVLLDKCQIKWVKNKEIFFKYFDHMGKQRRYYPDFYLPEYDLWVETKGKRYAMIDPYFELKKNCIKNLEVLFNKDVRELYKFI